MGDSCDYDAFCTCYVCYPLWVRDLRPYDLQNHLKTVNLLNWNISQMHNLKSKAVVCLWSFVLAKAAQLSHGLHIWFKTMKSAMYNSNVQLQCEYIKTCSCYLFKTKFSKPLKMWRATVKEPTEFFNARLTEVSIRLIWEFASLPHKLFPEHLKLLREVDTTAFICTYVLKKGATLVYFYLNASLTSGLSCVLTKKPSATAISHWK